MKPAAYLSAYIIASLLYSPVDLGGARAAAAPTAPEALITYMDAIPEIDGRIDENEWAGGLRVIGFMTDTGELEPRGGVFWIGSDGEKLYLAVRTEMPAVGELLARARPADELNRPFVFWDDNVEFRIAPAIDGPEEASPFFQIAVNHHGAVYDARLEGTDKDEQWRVDWNFASRLEDGQWSIEVAIPFEALGGDVQDFDLDTAWGIEVIRNWQQPDAQTGWGPHVTSLADRSAMPRVRWQDEGLAVRMLGLRAPAPDTDGVDVRLEVVNRAEESRDVEVRIDHQSEDNPPHELRETFTLDAGATHEVSVVEDILMGDCRTTIRVTEVGNERVLFSRTFDWRIDQPEQRWAAAQAEIQAARLDFGHYPYKRKLKARLDIAGLSAREAVTGAELQVIASNDQVLVEAPFPAFVEHRTEMLIDLPPLETGTYEVRAMLSGERVPSEPVVREFIRETFEWESNDLGITDEVVPPFTSLEVSDNEVRAVLRSHVMNDLGLWEQVVSEGREVLADAMRFEVKIDGELTAVELSGPIEFTQARPHRVSYRTDWRAGSITGVIEGTYDYDGMLKIELILDQDADETVDQFDLMIPLRADTAVLKHSATTGIRNNFAGYIPEGDGLVWESSEASRRVLRGTFIPYIWLGDESRGIAWFAESDRDWLYDDVTSTHRVYREDDRILLRVSFVTRPAPLGRQRRIVFGLQATPTKPMPEEPVHWRNWLQRAGTNNRFVERNQTHFFLAGSSTWGTMGHNAYVYPRDRDYYIYDLMSEVRQTGRRNEEREQEWFSRHDPDDPGFASHRSHVLWALRALSTQPDAVVPYTNPRGSVFNGEFITFQDEWLTDAYTSRIWPTDRPRAGLSYNVTPTRSYRDYAIWHFKKMLETFADAIYYDCTYLRQNHDLATGAYIGDHGELRPSVDIFNMREHLKRIQTLTWQMDRNWLASISHMTNAQIVPINTWAGVNMEWEMQYGMRNFQDRFTRDQIRTTAIGIQTGSVPQVLGTTGIRGDVSEEREQFVHRTLAGVAAVHEIKDIRSARGPIGEIYETFFNFGYGTPECRVYRYWDDPFPAEITGLDAEALVLANDGMALVLVVDFSEGGAGALTLDVDELDLVSGGEFVNLETGEILDRTDDYAVRFELKKHDFLLIMYRHPHVPTE